MSEEIVSFVGHSSKGKEGVVKEFLTPRELQKHQDEQTQPLLTEAIQAIHKDMLETPQKNDMRLLRVDLRFEPVMPRVVALLKEKGWRSDWEAIWTRDNTGQPSHKTHIRLSLYERIEPIS